MQTRWGALCIPHGMVRSHIANVVQAAVNTANGDLIMGQTPVPLKPGLPWPAPLAHAYRKATGCSTVPALAM